VPLRQRPLPRYDARPEETQRSALMQASMYSLSIPVFRRSLTSLAAILDKAAAYAHERKIDPVALLDARLYPDMLKFSRQVQLASDFAKGAAARLAGETPPKFDDVEVGFDELKGRIARTLEFIERVRPAQIDGSEGRAIELKTATRTLNFSGLDFLTHYALPNFFFHVTTAYAILRHNGVPIGKDDFLGRS
jgi:hypothetical protein